MIGAGIVFGCNETPVLFLVRMLHDPEDHGLSLPRSRLLNRGEGRKGYHVMELFSSLWVLGRTDKVAES